jgi:peptidyl-dipeptidase A
VKIASISIAILFALCAAPSTFAADNADPKTDTAQPLTAAGADAFVAALNKQYKADYPEATAAQWIAETYINGDTQLLVSRSNERSLSKLSADVEKSKAYAKVPGISAASKRSIELLKLSTAMPAPKDPAKLKELTEIASRLDGEYGAGKFCSDEKDPSTCRNLDDLSKVLANNRDWDADLAAWAGWHHTSRIMRKDYVRFAELLNDGAHDLGYNNVGELWRAGYDMPPAAFKPETDRLWGQVRPLYEQLQCYARGKLKTQYGDKMPKDGTIPAHVTGNMWAQNWAALYPLLQPYKDAGSLDVDGALVAQNYDAPKIVHRAEDFYHSIGFPALPGSFYEKSQLIRPRDRDVVCHASAWDLDQAGDVRIKMCINPTEENFRTVYHEMGHIYYFLAYNGQSELFQSGANDGFHEAIGDTIQLSLTPAYLHTIGLTGALTQDKKALLNAQMKLALEKIVFLPFGKMIDEWRWGVFDGSIKPSEYNAAWWKLKQKYQGVSSSIPRSEEDFDPGAKYHVASNTPYMRYFMANILQFQFQRALCQAAGQKGALAECSIYGSKAAGDKYWAMLQKGASQPWQKTLKELTGTEQMDASAIIDYFAPLYAWLKQQNTGQPCGWDGL